MEKVNKIVDHVILNQISAEECKICQVKAVHPSVSQTHYNSKKHNSKVNAYREDAIKMMVANQNALTNGDSKFTVPLIYEKPEVAKSEIFKCGVCKIDLDSKTWKDTHVNQFPHADLLKLKRETLKKGYKDDLYSLHQSKYIYCHICNVVLQCTSSVKSHCQSAKHQTKFNNLDIPVSDIPGYLCKWFFCKICNINLDGTSYSESHYAAFQQRYGPVSVNTAKTDFPVNTIVPKTKVFKNSSVQVNELDLAVLPIATNTDLPNSDNSANIKNEVLMELEKLAQTLYYSKKVPLDEALKYLKKVNDEVLSIIEKSEKNISHDKGQSSLQETVENSDVTNETDVSNDPAIVDNNVSQEIADQIDFEPDTRDKTLLDETAGKKLGATPKKCKTIEELAVEIAQEMRREQKKIGWEKKVEVLMEIYSLLWYMPTSDEKPDFPWQEILNCLKEFNATIERETSHFLYSEN